MPDVIEAVFVGIAVLASVVIAVFCIAEALRLSD